MIESVRQRLGRQPRLLDVQVHPQAGVARDAADTGIEDRRAQGLPRGWSGRHPGDGVAAAGQQRHHQGAAEQAPPGVALLVTLGHILAHAASPVSG